MKKLIGLSALILIATASTAYAAPEQIVAVAKTCCDLMAACCDKAMSCCG